MNYKTLTVPDYKEISNEVYQFIVDKTKILDQEEFWNISNLKSFCENNPKIINYFNSLGLTLINATVIHITGKRTTEVHIDGALDTVNPLRIQWGICNYENTRTALYEFKNPNIKPIQRYTNDVNKSPFLYIIPSNVIEIDSFVLDNGPVVWKPSMPHKVITGNVFPRLTLTCSFAEPLDFLLE